jgi:hypothetical protein
MAASSGLGNTHLGWVDWAERLSGESDWVRERAIDQIRKTPNLEEVLRRELDGPHRLLAMDAITSLSMKQMLPRLMELSERDEDGFSYLAINALIAPDTQEKIAALYRLRLEGKEEPEERSSVAKMAMLDGLALMHVPLSREALGKLLADSSFEARSAALGYLYSMRAQPQIAALIPDLLAKVGPRPWQIRQRARFLAEALPDAARVKAVQTLAQAPELGSKKNDEASAGRSFLRERTRELLDGLRDPSIAKKCRKAYSGFYSRQRIDLRIVFGYKDARPARFVGDRYERTALLQALTAPCEQADERYCGFERDSSDADLLRRAVRGPSGERHDVELRIVASSVGPDDDENRKNPLQKAKSKSAREVFLGGLKSADAVFYIGHSRDGGGPDFDPPRLSGSGHVMYSWYRTKHPGRDELLAAMQGSTRPSAVLGLFSCLSDRHFSQAVLKERAGGVITTDRLLYYDDALRDALLSVQALLTMRCSSDLEKLLSRDVKVSGFFH